MKDKRIWNFSRHLVLSAGITGVSCLCELLVIKVLGIKMISSRVNVPGLIGNFKQAASIGIIGGADGPTAIFLGGGAIEPFIVIAHQMLFFLLL